MLYLLGCYDVNIHLLINTCQWHANLCRLLNILPSLRLQSSSGSRKAQLVHSYQSKTSSVAVRPLLLRHLWLGHGSCQPSQVRRRLRGDVNSAAFSDVQILSKLKNLWFGLFEANKDASLQPRCPILSSGLLVPQFAPI